MLPLSPCIYLEGFQTFETIISSHSRYHHAIRKASMPVPAKEIQTGTVEQAYRMQEPEFEQIFRIMVYARAGY